MREPDLRRILSALGVEVVQRTHSGWLHAQCPFARWTHSSGVDRRPSFGAKVEEGGISAYQCHTCKMHGKIASLARALGIYRHQDRERYAELALTADAFDQMYLDADWERTNEDETLPEPIVEEIYANMFAPIEASPDGLRYLESRGISLQTAVSLGILYDPRQRRVVFPVRDGYGRCFGFTGRGLEGVEPKVRDYGGLKKRWHILGQHRWAAKDQRRRRLVLVEGLFAYAHLIHLNCERVADVGAILGSSLSNQQARIVLERGAPTYLMVDGDMAGDICLFGKIRQNGTFNGEGAIQALGDLNENLYVPAYPEGKDDPDQLTKAEVWQMLSQTDPWAPGVPPLIHVPRWS